MTTSFTEVYDIFMGMQDDYRLINLFQSSPENFTTYLTGWMIPAVKDFLQVCDQDLSYNLVTKRFNQTLTIENIVVLAQIIKKYWLNRTIDDITQMNAKIQDKDFTFYSEAQNYATKQARYVEMKEEISSILNRYAYSKESTWEMLLGING